jgi:pyruvate dehydrogenase E2 component (dihydrolipoamide acetyltransferase)
MSGSERGYEVVMPKLGLTMTEATIVEWCKQDGDHVEKGETLFVLESEKSTLEIEAPTTGVLQIFVPAGETVPVHQPIAMLFGAERISPTRPVPVAGRKAVSEADGQSQIAHRKSQIVSASPRARALARRLGIPLEGITGTGPRTMIVAGDVEVAAASRPETKASPVARKLAASAELDLLNIAGTGPGGRIKRADVERALSGTVLPQPAAPVASAVEPKPLSGLRAIIAERLSASWRERPHVTLTTEADATNLVSARQQAVVELDEKVSFDALLVALVARALREHPHVNVRLTEGGIETIGEINIGVALDTERGLLVPVVRDCASKSLAEIQGALRGLAERALAGRSLPDDLSGGTFTITNLGMFEIDAFAPIINPPESAILGVGRIVSKPVGLDGQIVLRDMMALSLSFDHRLLDGGPAARFLQRVKQLVESPFALAFGSG